MPVEGAPALALVALSFLVLYVLCIALAHAIVALLQWVANFLRSLPGIGGTVAGWMEGIAKAIAHAAGGLAGGVDKMIGGAWHLLSNYVDKALNQLIEHSAVLLHLAEIVGNGLYAVSGLRAFVRSISYVAHTALHLADKLQREYQGIEAKVRTIEHEIGAGIGNDVRTSVDHLLKWEKVAKGELATLEGELGKAVDVPLTDLEHFLGVKPLTKYLDWAAGIVTAAVGLEAFNLLKCGFLRNLWNNRGCGLWQGLDDILGLLFDAVLFADLCELLPQAVTLFGEFEAPLTELISGAANAACAQIPADWAVPTVSVGPLPPPQTLGDTLAA